MPAEKKLDFGSKVFWVDVEGNEYGLIVAGVGWPSVKPGHVVVGGVAAFENPDLDGFPIRILAEAEDPDLSGLFIAALKMKKEWSIDRFYAYQDPAFNETVRIFNSDRTARGLTPLYFHETEIEGEKDKILATVSLVKRLTRPGRKLLTFGPESTLPGYLVSLSPEEANEADVFDHPCIAALGACLGPLSRWRPQRGPIQTEAIMEFDVFEDRGLRRRSEGNDTF